MDILEPYAWFVPGVVVTVVATALLGRRIGAALAAGPILGSALVVALGTVISATLTPSHDALAGGAPGAASCDLTRLALPTLSQLAFPGDIALNIALFVPIGIILGLLPASPRIRPLVAVAYALPVGIEVVQLVVVPLGRACQSGDVIDNLTGLTLGLAAGGVIGWAAARRSGAHPIRRSRSAPGARTTAGSLATVVLLSSTLLWSTPSADQLVAPRATQAPAPTATPRPGESARVASIPALLDALADDHLREIVVADGTYRVSPAGLQAADSLWIGDAYAARTRSITIRAETVGGVSFDGGGAAGFGGIWFADGAHDQTWQGFTFKNGSPTNTGVVMFGEGSGVAPHHITLRDISIGASVTGEATSASAPANDHAIYVSQAIEGPHDLVFEDITVDGTGGLASAFHFYHSDATHRNAWNVVVRRLHVRGTQQAIMLWDDTLRDITFDTADIVDALNVAVRYEAPGATGIVLANVVSTGSGSGKGFHSSLGSNPPGVTFVNDVFR